MKPAVVSRVVPLKPRPSFATVQPEVSPKGLPYWFDERMHNWGNSGLRGRFHAFFAPLATRVIDELSYKGVVS